MIKTIEIVKIVHSDDLNVMTYEWVLDAAYHINSEMVVAYDAGNVNLFFELEPISDLLDSKIKEMQFFNNLIGAQAA